MRILSENTALNVHPPTLVRRILSIAAGLAVGAALGMTSAHAKRPDSSVLSEKPIAKAPALQAAQTGPSSSTRKVGWYQLGLASWYGKEFQGKETADGETFNMNDLTCAHRSLPLGTWLKVTNMHTRRWIVVRVNDRGPVPDTRIADLSSEAARMLGMHSRGVTRVRLDVIDPQQAIEVVRLEKLRLAREAAELQETSVGD